MVVFRRFHLVLPFVVPLVFCGVFPGYQNLFGDEKNELINDPNSKKNLPKWAIFRLSSTSSIQEKHVHSVAYSKDGNFLAIATRDKKIWLWNPKTGKLIRQFSASKVGVGCVRFSIDNKILATAGFDGDVRLWKTETGEEVHKLSGHHRSPLTVAFSPNGKTLASGGEEGGIRLWEVKTGKLLRQWIAHKREVLCLAFSPNGKTYLFTLNSTSVFSPGNNS